MRAFDFSPLFRSTVGFDRMYELLDAATRLDDSQLSYPPYNIEKTGTDKYRITMAVAGFGLEDLNIVSQENSLVIAGKAPGSKAPGSKAPGSKTEEARTQESQGASEYLHRGIGRRAFQRRFELADHIKVVGASLENGLLHVDLLREVPEEQKPRTIAINAGPRAIEGKLEQKAA
jgi:molecular chaperone IbpA